jgi:hypothetical protein
MSNIEILHSVQRYWRAVSFVLRETNCEERIIELAYQIGESYNQPDRYSSLLAAFLRNIENMVTFEPGLYNNIRYYTIELIHEQKVRFPFEFCDTFDIIQN